MYLLPRNTTTVTASVRRDGALVWSCDLPFQNTLQHAATHCNTLQHTATHCNTLQHVATHTSDICVSHCKRLLKSHTLQHTATHCNSLQHNATHCYTLQHTATHYNTLQHTATHCNTLQQSATHCNTLQHTATHCNTLQHTATHTCVSHRSVLCVRTLWLTLKGKPRTPEYQLAITNQHAHHCPFWSRF